MMRSRRMQPLRQSLQTLILLRTSFKKYAFTAYAPTPTSITNVAFIKHILQTWCVYGICSHTGNHYKRWFDQGHPSTMMCLWSMQPHQQSLQTLIWSRISFKNDAFMACAATSVIITNDDFIKDILQKWCVF
jgi:hypothetical protein